MGTCCSNPVDYEHLSVLEKTSLNFIFENLVTEASVDFSNPEIQDIQSAVFEMLGRTTTQINERGVLSIPSIEPGGSMAEKTAMWKYSFRSMQPFIEFDFLAVLQAACDIERGCQECFCVNTLQVNLEECENIYRSFYNLHSNDQREQREILKECFIRETNDCLASCGCLAVTYRNQQEGITFMFEPSSTCSETQQGCDKCTVDRPSGTLQVKSSVEIGVDGEHCSLIFDWTSKTKTLCTRNTWCLPETKKTEQMDNLTIQIDFLPALELFQSKQQSTDVAPSSSCGLVLNPISSEYERYCFLVAKHCTVCRKGGTWRRSGCRAEIDTIVNKMSDKHRKCYQVLKYLIEKTKTYRFKASDINNYHVKVAILHHNSSCSIAGEDCAKCVFKVLDELQHAYATCKLKSLHSQANMKRAYLYDHDYFSACISIIKEAISFAVSESDSVPLFLHKFDNAHKRLYKRLYELMHE